jgi:hypothetical protein
MVSVVEMSPEDYPGEIAGSYGEACAALGLASAEAGYALVLDQDEAGAPVDARHHGCRGHQVGSVDVEHGHRVRV